MTDRKTRSNKGKTRPPTGVITKCVAAFINKTLKLTKTGTPFLKTKAGNRYSCKSELKKKGMTNYKKPVAGQKPTVRPSQFKKGTVRNGFVVKMVKVPTGAGYRKAWRKL